MAEKVGLMTKVRLTRWAYERLLLRASHDAEDVVMLIKEAAGINDMPHIKGVTVLDTELGDPLVDFLTMKEDDGIILDIRMRYSQGGLSYTLGSSSVAIKGLPHSLEAAYAAKTPFPLEDLIDQHPYREIRGATVNKVTRLNLITIFSTDRSCKANLVENYPDTQHEWEVAAERKRA